MPKAIIQHDPFAKNFYIFDIIVVSIVVSINFFFFEY